MDFLPKVPLSLVSFLFVSVVGCGGAPMDNPNYLERHGLTPPTRTVTVTVSGSAGTVVVAVGTSTLTFAEDGSQQLTGLSLSDTISASITSSPEGQICIFSPSNQTSITVGTSVLVDCGAPEISGIEKNFFTDALIAGATVRVTHSVDGVDSEFASVTSDADGAYSVTGIDLGDRYVLTASASGFAPFSSIALPTSIRPSIVENMFLLPVNGSDTADPALNMSFALDGVTVLEIPADGLLTAGEGELPEGNVTAQITFLDPSSAPRSLSGRYEVIEEGIVSHMQSYGAISIMLRDGAGNKLALAEGITAQLSIPVASGAVVGAPANSTVLNFDEDAGYWQSPADAVLATQGTVTVYEAEIATLADVYTVGDNYTPANVQGCIEDSRGNKIAGATIVSQGRNYIGLAFGVSDAEGNFTVPARQNSSILVYGLVGSQSRTVEATTTTGTTTLSTCIILDQSSTVITLTWGENPSDLDSQLFGPQPDSTARFHIYYAARTFEANGVSMFLDVDDVTSFGPEVTTIPSFPVPGVYEFFVKRFSGSSTIQLSPARVEVNAQGENFAFSPPAGTATDCWHVFNINVDSSLTGEVVAVNDWVAGNVCDVGRNGVLAAGYVPDPQPVLQKVSPAQRAIERKYYAR